MICKECNIDFDEHSKLFVKYKKDLCRNCYNNSQKEIMRKRITKDIYSYFDYILQQIKRRKWEVNIDRDYLVELFNSQEGKCKVTGITLKINKGRKYNSISVDRIDNTKGYIKGNIQIVCYGYNSMKSNHDIETFKLLIEKTYNYLFK